MFRLLPMFLAASIFAHATNVATGKFNPAMLTEMSPLQWIHTLLSNLFIIGYNFQKYQALGPAWSLDVELQFYILLPILYFVATKSKLLGFGTLAALCVLSQGTAIQESIVGYAVFFYAGMLPAVLRWTPNDRLAKMSLFVFAAIIIAAFATDSGRQLVVGGSHQAEGFFARNQKFCAVLALVLLPFTIWTTQQRTSQQDKNLGDLSYSTYLFHYPLAIIYGHLYGQLPIIERAPYLMGYLLATAVVAYLAWRLIDKPLMAYRQAKLDGFMAQKVPQPPSQAFGSGIT
jgi:peptidoglycan/LPS O-acetylase OafA/YrhL